MGTAIVTPTADGHVGVNWQVLGGGGTHYASQADSSDVTYSNHQSIIADDYLILDLGNPVIPALAQIRSVQLYTRAAQTVNVTVGAYKALKVAFRLASTGHIHLLNAIHPTNVITDFYSPQPSVAPNGAAWTSDLLNDLQLFFQLHWSGSPSNADFRVYKSYVSIVYNEAPVVTVTAPTGTVSTTTTPTVSWTYTDPEGDSQERVEIAVFTAAQYGIAGFDPTSSPATYRLPSTYTSVNSWVLESLANSTTYRVYVRASDSGSSGRFGNWAYSGFSTLYNAPALPKLTAVANPTFSRVDLTIQGLDNMLTKNQADVETDTTGWAAFVNATIDRFVTASAFNGGAVLRLTSAAAGYMQAASPVGTAGFAVAVGTMYTGSAWFRTAVTSRQCQIEIWWYNSAGTFLSYDTGPSQSDVTGSWTQAAVTATAPINAAYGRLVLTVLATGGASEQHWIDGISVIPSNVAPTAWSRGGLLPLQRFEVQRNIPLEDPEFITFSTPSRNLATEDSSDTTQLTTISDYTAPRGVPLTYQVRAIANESGNILIGPWSLPAYTELPLDDNWMVKLVYDSDYNFIANAKGPTWARGSEEDTSVYKAIGRDRVIVLTDQIYGDNFSLTFMCTNQTEVDDVVNIRAQQKTMLIQDPIGRQWYVRSTGGMAINEIFVSEDPYQEITIHFEEVDPPNAV